MERKSPGTVVIDTSNYFLYLVVPDGKAMRHGIGVGRPVSRDWCTCSRARKSGQYWVPPDEMISVRPYFYLTSSLVVRAVDWAPARSTSARRYTASTCSNEPWTIGRKRVIGLHPHA